MSRKPSSSILSLMVAVAFALCLAPGGMAAGRLKAGDGEGGSSMSYFCGKCETVLVRG